MGGHGRDKWLDDGETGGEIEKVIMGELCR